MRLVRQFFQSLSQEGWQKAWQRVIRTVRIRASLIYDLVFDWKYGVKTIKRIDLQDLDIPSDNKKNGKA